MVKRTEDNQLKSAFCICQWQIFSPSYPSKSSDSVQILMIYGSGKGFTIWAALCAARSGGCLCCSEGLVANKVFVEVQMVAMTARN